MNVAVVPPGQGMPALPPHSIQTLREDECWRLVGERSVARLAVIAHDGAPDIFPVNVLIRAGKVYYRSGGGTKMVEVLEHERVAFEFDGEDGPWRWSVVIRGAARRMDGDDEIEASGVLGLVTLAPTPKNDFMEVTPSRVSGRRFRTDFPEPLSRSDHYGRGGSL